jgi:PAS domain S-box-containing protein
MPQPRSSRSASSRRGSRRRWRHLAPVLAGVAVVVASALMAASLSREQARSERELSERAAAAAGRHVESDLGALLAALDRVAERWPRQTPAQRVAEIPAYTRDFSMLQSLHHLDAAGRLVWSQARPGWQEPAGAFEAVAGMALSTSADRPSVAAWQAPATGVVLVLLRLPIAGSGGESLVAVLSGADLASAAVAHAALGYQSRLALARLPLDPTASLPPADAAAVDFALAGGDWSLSVWPDSTTSRSPGLSLAWWVILGAFPLALAVAAALWVAELARERSAHLAAANTELATRAGQQAAIAALGERALAASDVDSLLRDAAGHVAAALGVELSAIFERVSPDALVLRAGEGWPAEALGTRLPLRPDSTGAEVLRSGAPLVVADAAAEGRLRDVGPLVGHGVVSGVGVAIPGPTDAWGLLGAGSRTLHPFSTDDVRALRSFANVLGAALSRARAEDGLRQVQERLQQLLRHSPAVLFSLSPEPPFATIYASANVERIFGFPAADFTGDGVWLERLHPDDRAVARAANQRWQAEGEAGFDYRFQHRDGSWRWMHNQLTLIRDARGEPVEVIGVAYDVTAQRELEENLRHAVKMEAVGRLAGGVAHDFNNLLTTIGGYSELALLALPPDHPARPDLEEIRRAGERAATLTRQLLAFSRRQVLQPRLLDLNSVVADTGKMLGRVLGEDVQLVLDLAAAPVPVEADPGQLEQVLLNLAVNCRDAMPDGGRLVIATGELTIDVARGEGGPGRWACLRVSDDGHGMPPEVSERIFEPFFTTKGQGRGSGLGLAMVDGIVHQSGGWIEVHSAPGEGTTFAIYLPWRAPSDRTDDAAEQLRDGVAPGGETVLVAEDDDHVRGLVVRALEARGYRVLAGADGGEALAAAAAAPRLDLLVSDVVMPDLRGPELRERVLALHPETPVLFVSGYADRDLRLVAEGDGVAFLQKPFTPDALLRRVRQILDRPPASPEPSSEA